jgi:hypothetical protein
MTKNSGAGDDHTKPVKGWGPRKFDGGKQTDTTYAAQHAIICERCARADPCFDEDAETFFSDLDTDPEIDLDEENTAELEDIEKLLEEYVNDDLDPSETMIGYAGGYRTITNVVKVMRAAGEHETADLIEEMSRVGVEGAKFFKSAKRAVVRDKTKSTKHRIKRRKKKDSGV